MNILKHMQIHSFILFNKFFTPEIKAQSRYDLDDGKDLRKKKFKAVDFFLMLDRKPRKV